jgi:multiple sugar transport system substrate-binding protein
MAKSRLSRRDFLKMSAAATASTAFTSLLPFRAAAQDVTTIRLMAWGDDTEVAAREATLAMFHEANPNIRVEFLHTPNADYGTKLQTMLAGGDYPDVFFLGNGDAPAYVQRGQLLALDDLIARDSFDLSDVFPANLALYNVNDLQYGFPVDAPSQQVFYNASRFEAAGIEPPSSDWADESWTWDAFLEKAIALTDADNNLWGWQVKSGFRFWWVWVTANGGDFFSEDGAACVLNSPESVEALQFLADLIHVHRVAPPMDVASEMGSATLFETGVTAMETYFPAIGYMRTHIGDKFTWDVAPHPAGKAGKACAGGGTGHVISANSPNPDAAWEFLKFVISQPAVERWTEIMGIVPPLQSVANSEVFLTPGQPPANIQVFTEGAPYLRPDPRHPAFVQARTIAETELQRLWLGGTSAQEVADSIVEQVNRLL